MGAYVIRFCPTLVLIDKRGHLRCQHIGEGAYAEIEAATQARLAQSCPAQSNRPTEA